jgi:hypothetical protein
MGKKFWSEARRKRDHLGENDVDVRIRLKLILMNGVSAFNFKWNGSDGIILEETDCEMQTEVNWLRGRGSCRF